MLSFAFTSRRHLLSLCSISLLYHAAISMHVCCIDGRPSAVLLRCETCVRKPMLMYKHTTSVMCNIVEHLITLNDASSAVVVRRHCMAYKLGYALKLYLLSVNQRCVSGVVCASVPDDMCLHVSMHADPVQQHAPHQSGGAIDRHTQVSSWQQQQQVAAGSSMARQQQQQQQQQAAATKAAAAGRREATGMSAAAATLCRIMHEGTAAAAAAAAARSVAADCKPRPDSTHSSGCKQQRQVAITRLHF
jgi:hypothetical protein